MATLQRLSRLQNIVLRHSLRCRCQIKFTRQMASVDSSKQLSNPQDANLIDQSEELEALKKHFANSDPKALKVSSDYLHASSGRTLVVAGHSILAS